MYGFAGGDPVNFDDPFGLWPFGTHNKIIDAALPNAGFIDRTLIKLGSVLFDVSTQGQTQSYLHGMSEAGQNPLAQQAGTAEFVEGATGAATVFQATGRHVLAMITIGAAIHPVMDATSPSHSDANGKPQVWNPADLSAHRKGERGSPTPEQQKKMGERIRAIYDQVAKP